MNFYSFKKADRLLKRHEFLRLSTTGKKISDPYFTVIFLPGSTDRVRLGITVTKKVGNAVIRNRIKRLCREYFRLNRHKLKGIWDINLIAKKVVTDLTSEQIFLSLDKMFSRISKENEN